MRRRQLVLIGLAVVLVCGVAGFVTVRAFSTTARAVVAKPSEPPPATWTSVSAEPATVMAKRENAAQYWAQVVPVGADRVPPPKRPPVDCYPAYQAVLAAGGRDADRTSVRIEVQPKSFQVVTITRVRLRALAHQPAAAGARFFYSCKNLDSLGRNAMGYLVQADRLPLDLVLVGAEKLPKTVEAKSAWWVQLSVVALSGAYTWQVEVEYSANGKAYSQTVKADSAGFPLVTEAVGKAQDYAGFVVWCDGRFQARESCPA